MYPSIIHEWFEEVWNQGKPEAVYRILDPKCTLYHLDEAGKDAHGPDEFLAFFTRFRGAFPDMHIQVHDAIQSGDKVAGRWTVTGTHLGDQLGMAPTRNPIRIEGMSYARAKDGRIVEGWNSWDTLALFQQLNSTQASNAAAR